MHDKPDTDIATCKLTLTVFRDETGSERKEIEFTLSQWQEHILSRSADNKDQLRWLKGAIFGSKRSENGSLRTNTNVKLITAPVVEYDGPRNGVEKPITFDEAIAIIEKARLRAVVYTSPSHKAAEPRWRIIFPSSHHESNPVVRHEALVAMVNGLFNGQLAPESFTLSQCYYYGRVGDNPDHRVEIIDGDFLNLRDDLFAGRIYRDGGAMPRAERSQPKSKVRKGGDPNVWEKYADDMRGPADKDEVRFALHQISSDNYLVWMAVGASLADEFGEEEGFELWDPWSQTSDKYLRDQLRDQSRRQDEPPFIEKKWGDFAEMTEYGIGTVFHLATEANPDWREQYRQLRREKEDEFLTADHAAAANSNGAAGTDSDATTEHETVNDDASEQSKISAKPPKIKATPFQWIDPTKIPLRQWLYKPFYIRQFVSLTVSTGGVGKSSHLIVEALAMVSGKDLLNVSTDGELLRVWYWNGEDPTDELQRRFAAAIKHFQLTSDDIGDRLFLDSGRKMRIVLAEENKGDIKINMDVIEDIVRTLEENKIDVLIIDPHIAAHRVSENDNTAIERVAKAWGYIAEVANCAVMLAHHTRKTLNGSNVLVDDGRGASALRDAVRAARALNTMTKEEAEKIEIDPSQRGLYFRSDNGKANLTPPAERADWFKLVSVDLENNIAPGIPGDEIGVVTAWEYPTPAEVSVGIADLKRMQEVVTAGGPWRRNRQAKSWIGNAIAQAFNRDTAVKQHRQWIEKHLALWLQSGLLKVDSRPDPTVRNRAAVEFVIAGRLPTASDTEEAF